MATFKRNSSSERKGKVTYNSKIVNGIVSLAVSDVAGVSLVKDGNKLLDSIKIALNGDSLAIDVTVDLIYGYNVSDVAFNIQQNIKHNVESMSKYKVASVDVHVKSVSFDGALVD